MNDTHMQARRELVADLQHMVSIVQEGLQAGESPAVWSERRQEIAALRQRIRTLRARPWAEPSSRA